MPETGDTRAEHCAPYGARRGLLMRIRSIKPEFWRSDDIAALSIEDRLLFVGLWSYVDDNGVGRDQLADICADLFSRDWLADPRETVARVSRGLQHLETASLITRYNVDGRPFLHVSSWERHQRVDRPNRPRYPAPDQGIPTPSRALATPSRQSRDSLDAGAVEQRNRGTEEQGITTLFEPSSNDRPTSTDLVILEPTRNVQPARTRSQYPDAFETFWQAFPRHEGKRKALPAWQTACKRASSDEILDGAIRYREDPNREDAYTAHPTTWLNRDGWHDAPLPQRRPESQQDRLAESAARMFRDLNAQTRGA